MIGTTLAHYRITAALGAGGMGEVWRATDTKLGRDVALKVLPEEFADDAVRLDRFEREARAVASLNHPHIVTIYSVEDADGIRFLTMELVEGKTLDGMIPDGGFDLATFFELATPLAEAISAAHDKSVIHRDLKPANVMVDGEGRVKVMDFGLAKLQETTDPSDSSELPTEALTGVGMIVGTVPYMSPEQIEGLVVDHRTDIFSLGVLLYEMAIGERPFKGSSSPALMSSILKDVPSSVIEIRDDLPRHLARVIGRCLEKDRRDRYQTARDVFNELKALRRESSSILAQNRRPTAVPSRQAPRPSSSSSDVMRGDVPWIAVLPFGCPSGEGSVEAFADGLEEDIASGLSRFSYLFVVARKSTGRYRSEAIDVRQVGEELGARFVMEGGIRQAGSTIRINVQIVDTETGTHLWAETFDRDLDETAIFAIQDDITDRVVATVADPYGVVARSMAIPTGAMEPEEMTAYQAVLRYFLFQQRLSQEDHLIAREALERAVEIEPGYADAWSCLTLVVLDEDRHDFNRRPDALDRALSAARRGVEADPASSFAYYALATVNFYRRDLGSFRANAEKAIKLNRRNGNVVAMLGVLYGYSGDWKRGVELTTEAMELNPHHPGWYRFTTFFDHYLKGDFDEALKVAQKINMPGYYAAHMAELLAHTRLGNKAAAENAAREMLHAYPAEDMRGYGRHAEMWFYSQPDLLNQVISDLRSVGVEVDTPGGEVHTPVPAPNVSAPAASPISADTETQQVAIAVLPFADMSPEKDQDYFCEGMAEEIMNALVRIEGIRVASRTSAFRAQHDGHGLAEIARLLSVSHILEGSVRTAGNRLRVTAQLTAVSSSHQLWSERFDRELQDVFAVQDEIAAGVVEAVEARLAPGTRTIPARPQARNLEAYRSYLLGQHLRYAKEDHGGAVRAFQEAIRLDPTHAPSWTGLAESLALSAHMSLIPSHEACAGAQEALATALELQGESADGLHGEGFVAFIERRWKDLEAAVRRAIEIEPSHVPSLGLLGMCLSLHQKPDEAEPFFERARQADPLASFPYMLTALGLLTARRPQEAHSYAEQALTFEKEDASALFCSSLANVALGHFEEGIAAAEHGVAVSHRGADFLGLLGWSLATAGREDEARTLLEELRARPADAPPIVSEGWLLGALGEIDAAFEVFARAEDQQQLWLYYTGLPAFDLFRADPRFVEIENRLGLPSSPTPENLTGDAPGPSAGRKSGNHHGSDLAVAPIECDRSDSELCSLADGLEEELTSSFAQFAYLQVRETDAVAGVGTSASGVGEVWRTAGIRYLVTGRLLRVGDTLRLSVRLLDTVSGRRLWSASYDLSLSDFNILELQDHLADRVVATVADSGGVLVRSIADGLRLKAPQDYNPTDWVMRTFAYWNQMREEEHANLREGLEAAVERDPHHSAIWACLSQVYLDEHRSGFNPRDQPLRRALRAALTAVELNPRDSLALESLADVYFFLRDLTSFRLTAEKALAINPRDATTMASMGMWLALSGELERGCELAHRAMELNQEHAGWFHFAPYFHHFHEGRFEEALTSAKSITMPDFYWSHMMVAAAAGKLGLEADGRAAATRLRLFFDDPAEDARREAEKFVVPEGLLVEFLDGLRRAGLEIDGAGGEAADTGAPQESATGESSEAVAIAVLPFTDMSPNKDQDYICEGMAEEIMNALVHVDGIRVASRTSSFRAVEEGNDLEAIGRALSVGQVLEGSVRMAGSRLRVTAQLTEIASGYQLWSERYDREAADVFAIQDEIAAGVVEAVTSRLDSGVQTVPSREKVANVEAYRHYLKGRHYRYSKNDHAKALESFDEAVALDPGHAPSWIGRAEVSVLAAVYSLIPARVAYQTAKDSLATANRLQGDSADGFYVEGMLAFCERRWEDSEAALRRSIELRPTFVQAHCWLGFLHSAQQRGDEAASAFAAACEIDPLAPFPYAMTACGHLALGRPRDAIEPADQAMTFERENSLAMYCSGIAKVAIGEFDEGLNELEAAVRLTRRGDFILGVFGWGLAVAGRRAEAEAVLEELQSRSNPAPTAVSEVWILAALGDMDGAWRVLDRAEDEIQAMISFAGMPPFDPLRSNPRFVSFLERVGLPRSLSSVQTGGATDADPCPEKSIAVLPFVNMSADPENEYFSDGLSEEIINALTRLPGLRVIARTSAFRFRGEQDLRKVGEALGVENLLEGSVRKAGQKLRITAQLIDVADDSHIWSERFDRELVDVFAIQDEISAAIVEKLHLSLGAGEPATRERSNVAALDALLEARHFFSQFTPTAAERALACIQQALSIEPDYPDALVLQVFHNFMMGYMFADPREVLPQAKSLAERALELDPHHGEAQATVAILAGWMDRDWSEGERHYRRALELAPGSARVHELYGLGSLLAMGRLEESLSELDRAVELDPLSALYAGNRGRVLTCSRRFAEAEATCRRGLALDPGQLLAQVELIYALTFQQRYEEAIAIGRKAIELHGPTKAPLNALALSLALAGEHDEARQLIDAGTGAYQSPLARALVHAVCSEMDEAIEYAQRAIDEYEPLLWYLAVHPMFDALREDPRYPDLLRRMNLEGAQP